MNQQEGYGDESIPHVEALSEALGNPEEINVEGHQQYHWKNVDFFNVTEVLGLPDYNHPLVRSPPVDPNEKLKVYRWRDASQSLARQMKEMEEKKPLKQTDDDGQCCLTCGNNYCHCVTWHC